MTNEPVSSQYILIHDWKILRKRYELLWKRELDRGGFIAQIQNPAPDKKRAWQLNEYLPPVNPLNPEQLLRYKEAKREAWQWHYDLFHYEVPSYGPNIFIGFCGAEVSFLNNTVWHNPVISSLDQADKIYFNENNIYWKATLEIVDYFIERCKGVKQLAMCDFGGPADWIAGAMGTENFLIEAIERPEKMRELAIRLAKECRRAFDIVYGKIAPHNDGIVNWMPVWNSTSMSTLQDDISVNLSPSLYKEIFIPALKEMASYVDSSILHWHDACAHHIENLLRIKEIGLIQFGHDPTTGPFTGHIKEMQKIQDAGKILFISCVAAEDVEFFVNNLDPRGLAMIIDTSGPEQSKKMAEEIPELTENRMKNIE